MYDSDDPMVVAFALDLLTNPHAFPGIALDWLEEQGVAVPPYEERLEMSWWQTLLLLIERSADLDAWYLASAIQDRTGAETLESVLRTNWSYSAGDTPHDYPQRLCLTEDGILIISSTSDSGWWWDLGYYLGETHVVFESRLDLFEEWLATGTRLYNLLTLFFLTKQLADKGAQDLYAAIRDQIQGYLARLEQLVPQEEPEDEEPEDEYDEDQLRWLRDPDDAAIDFCDARGCFDYDEATDIATDIWQSLSEEPHYSFERLVDAVEQYWRMNCS